MRNIISIKVRNMKEITIALVKEYTFVAIINNSTIMASTIDGRIIISSLEKKL